MFKHWLHHAILHFDHKSLSFFTRIESCYKSKKDSKGANMVEKVLQLRCQCNNYPWGKKGKESLAARLCAQTPNTDFKIDESKDYAEMWMGVLSLLFDLLCFYANTI